MKTNTINPYFGKPERQFWKSAISEVPPGLVENLVDTQISINRTTRVSSMGSCFAQRIGQFLNSSSFNFVSYETPIIDSESNLNSTHVSSANYGNIYTVRHALQLLKRSLGIQESQIEPWELNGRWFDPYRSGIKRDGFSSIEELNNDQERHLEAVLKMFKDTEVLIFTLGLTECWVHKKSLDVIPSAPGVIAGSEKIDDYFFYNFSVLEIVSDLMEFVQELKEINKNIKIILTVSPVSLKATFENQHILVSNTYSKAVLRSAAGEVAKNLIDVEYFPSFEVITNPTRKMSFFLNDFREVSPSGVRTVMKTFEKMYFVKESSTKTIQNEKVQYYEKDRNFQVVCDEDLIEYE
jgi:hypothetical protein